MNRSASLTVSIFLAALFVALAALPASAANDVYSDRTMEIGRKLNCPVCQGQTVADSHSRVALEMMEAIEAQVQAGRTDDEIFDYFRVRYGDEVLAEPPREGINLALWWVPVVGALLGLGVVALYFRDSIALGRRGEPEQDDPTDAELEQLAQSLLSDPDTELT